MHIASTWLLAARFGLYVISVYDSICADRNRHHHKRVLGHTLSISAAKEVDTFLSDVVLSFTPVYPILQAFESEGTWVTLMWGVLVARRVKYQTALHAGEVWHQMAVVHFYVTMGEGV